MIRLIKYTMKQDFLQVEKELWQQGYKAVIGLDEVGRGAVAGPVVACAVILKKKKNFFTKTKIKFPIFNNQIYDSKKLTPQKREEFYDCLTKDPNIKWGIGWVSERVIEKINILAATKLAMKRALTRAIKFFPARQENWHDIFLIVDGNSQLDLAIAQKAIVRADERVLSCAIASIIAKVTRDRMMRNRHKKYPFYGFDQHKGYLTKQHQKMLEKYGYCRIHRKSFQPIKHLL
ncbi:MAG: ribonuclease HII [Minisyncoccales bacterium]